MMTSRDNLVATLWRDFFTENPPLTIARTAIETVYECLHTTLRDGHQVLVCGNGGSASDAEHIAGELAKPCALSRPLSEEEIESLAAAGDDGYLATRLARGLPVWPLVSQSALMTAIVNDQGGDLIFAQQVMAYGRPGDVLWVLSTSGSSRNVLYAARTAKARGMLVVAFTGPKRSTIAEVADVVVALPGADTPHVQQNHQLAYHAVCLAVEAAFYG
ncbi:MAG: SIS domain-containing protein [Acidobacteria bacterium]|nr:SIS domain-containing protein [Acidobacteriota bacterium]